MGADHATRTLPPTYLKQGRARLSAEVEICPRRCVCYIDKRFCSCLSFLRVTSRRRCNSLQALLRQDVWVPGGEEYVCPSFAPNALCTANTDIIQPLRALLRSTTRMAPKMKPTMPLQIPTPSPALNSMSYTSHVRPIPPSGTS
jgi:hypothetical protein